MSITIRILKRLQKSLPGTRLCKDVLVLTPTERIVRGFTFERTIEKGRYYFWRVVMPLYSPTDFLHLTYSNRISDGKMFYLSPENIDEVTSQILKIVLDEDFDYLRDIRHPKDFLSVKIGHPGLASSIDHAVTYFLLGDITACIKLLEEGLAKNPYPDYPHAKEASALLKDLKASPANAVRRIEGWERANIEMLGLRETMGRIA